MKGMAFIRKYDPYIFSTFFGGMGRGPRAPSYLTPTMRLCGRVCPTNGPAWGILALRFMLAGRRGGPFLRLIITSLTRALFLTAIYLHHPCFAGWHAHAKGSRVLLWRVYSNVAACPVLGTICSVKRTQHIPKRLAQWREQHGRIPARAQFAE